MKPLPPYSKVSKGFQVLVENSSTWHETHLGEQSCWIPMMNCYGQAYVLKGFAINSAKRMANHRAHFNQSTRVCVIEQSSGDVVWKSWEQENE